MADTNPALRKLLAEEASKDRWDIKKRVKRHANRAYQVALMSNRPPGYEIEDWALHLMDKTEQALSDRLLRRSLAMAAQALATSPETWGGKVFLVPDPLPAKLATKMRHLYQGWLRDFVVEECQKVLEDFIGLKSSPELLAGASAAVEFVVDKIKNQVGPLPWNVSVHGDTCGKFDLVFDGGIDPSVSERGYLR